MRLLALPLLITFASPACAAELLIMVKTPKGAPVQNAVATFYPAGRPVPPAGAPGRYQIAQKSLQFTPFVLVVPVGAQVAFPNLDTVRHHVYSFSPVKKFELKLFAKAQSGTVRFDKVGAVPIGCNIHDQMTAFIKVVDTALSGQSDRDGRIRVANVPEGSTIVRIWHPYLRAPGNEMELRWNVGAGNPVQSISLNLRSPPRVTGHY